MLHNDIFITAGLSCYHVKKRPSDTLRYMSYTLGVTFAVVL